MNIRKGYYWAIQIRPCSDLSGMSDCIVCTPVKSHARERAKECCGPIYDIIWEGWIKYWKTPLKRVKRF